MLDWLIVGGGLHGTTIHGALTRVDPGLTIRVVDPFDTPCHSWFTRTDACAMRMMRSPAAHTALEDFTGLMRFARSEGYDLGQHTTPPYARPSTELFNRYLQTATRSRRLASDWLRGWVVDLQREGAAWTATLDEGKTVRSRAVMLCVGRGHSHTAGDQGLERPSWARTPSIVHVFDPGFDRARLERARRPVIIGGGTTALHLALHLGTSGRPCTVVTRHPLRCAQFDSDPCYIGPKCMRGFIETRDHEGRRRMIDAARNPGTAPPDLLSHVRDAERDAAIRVIVDTIGRVEDARDGSQASLCLVGRDTSILADQVCIATGFADGVPAASLLARAAASVRPDPHARYDSRGIPVPGETLEWLPGLYLSGILAEQELGPSAPNIIGAQNAAKRLTSALCGRVRPIPSAWRRYASIR
ncbi:MAG: hypothetical protein EA382_04715 [Spirochaetaceae bacterium]|nr:MAG: hypothetical protein EA382_04715 [Spirochaetaceae bacterium]